MCILILHVKENKLQIPPNQTPLIIKRRRYHNCYFLMRHAWHLTTNSSAQTPTILPNCSVTDAVTLHRAHPLAKTNTTSNLPQDPTCEGTACLKDTVPVDTSSAVLASALEEQPSWAIALDVCQASAILYKSTGRLLISFSRKTSKITLPTVRYYVSHSQCSN